MNVLVVSQRVPFPPNKGEKLRTFHQLKYLVENGIRLTVLAPAETVEDITDAEQLANTLGISVYPVKVSVSPLKLFTGLIRGEALSVAKFYDGKVQAKFDELLATDDYGQVLFTASSLTPYWWNRSVSLTRPLRLFCDFMDVDSNKWFQYSQTASFLMRLIYKREAKLIQQLEIQSCKNFERCFLIADKEVELMSSFLPDDVNRPLAIGNGIDTQEFYPLSNRQRHLSNKNEPVTFLFVGVMDYKPNVDAVLWFVNNIWSTILQKLPSAKFKIVGMSPTPKVLSLASIKGIEVTGKVDDVTQYFQAADIFVAPFTIARGVQNKILQAMACSLPVVTTSKGAEGINCVHQEDILIADDASSFIAEIEYLLCEDNAWHIAKASRLRIVNEYSWEGNLLPLKSAILNGDMHAEN